MFVCYVAVSVVSYKQLIVPEHLVVAQIFCVDVLIYACVFYCNVQCICLNKLTTCQFMPVFGGCVCIYLNKLEHNI